MRFKEGEAPASLQGYQGRYDRRLSARFGDGSARELVARVRARRCFAPDLLRQIPDELLHPPFDWMDTHPVPVVAPSDLDAVRRVPRAVRLMLDQPRRRR